MSASLEQLLRYWQRELPPDEEAALELLLFEDSVSAERLELVARLDAGVRALIARGSLQAALTVSAADQLSRQLDVRTYRVDAGVTVPCTIADEDLVVIRLRGDFGNEARVDVLMEGTFDELPPASERYDDLAVDRSAGEIVLVYPGDRIRQLPRSRFRYTVSAGGRTLGEFGLDHSPRPARAVVTPRRE